MGRKLGREKPGLLVAAIIGILILFQPQPGSGINGPYWLDRFEKYEDNPILLPRGVGFEAKAVFNPAVILEGTTFWMLYRAEDWTGREEWHGQSTLGLAWSQDGINFTRRSEPVMVPEYSYELPGGCEDPRIVKFGDTYYLTYTAYEHGGRGALLCLATSKDLLHWDKKGLAFPDQGWTKAGAIVPEKINGKYWMYFGAGKVWLASSPDLIHWECDREKDIVLRPREGYFDEDLCEPGPPPVITDDGILLIYNGACEKYGYATGWALFSRDDPAQLIQRCWRPILTVTEDFEKTGQVYRVVFSEGLVKRDETWWLYYGCADNWIGVAISEPVYPILEPQGEGFERDRVYNPTLLVAGTTVWMIYRAEGKGTGTGALGLAYSQDGIDFTRYENNPVIKGEENFDGGGCEDPRIVKFGDIYYLFYAGKDNPTGAKGEGPTPGNICLATSKDLIHWEKHGEVLQPKYDWESSQIKAPAPVPKKIKGKYWMYYQGEKKPWHTRMGIAYSKDLVHWQQALKEPVMKPREDYWDSQGTEPGVAIIVEKGIFLIYNGWEETCLNKLGWALFSKKDPTKLIARCEQPIISYPNNHEFCEGLARIANETWLYYGYADTWIERKFIDIDQLLDGVK